MSPGLLFVFFLFSLAWVAHNARLRVSDKIYYYSFIYLLVTTTLRSRKLMVLTPYY